MSELKIGDVVQLKSGGPQMTIDTIGETMYEDYQSAWCTWFDKNTEQKGTFPLTSLQPYKEKEWTRPSVTR